jgi:hypothetical protein
LATVETQMPLILLSFVAIPDNSVRYYAPTRNHDTEAYEQLRVRIKALAGNRAEYSRT